MANNHHKLLHWGGGKVRFWLWLHSGNHWALDFLKPRHAALDLFCHGKISGCETTHLHLHDLIYLYLCHLAVSRVVSVISVCVLLSVLFLHSLAWGQCLFPLSVYLSLSSSLHLWLSCVSFVLSVYFSGCMLYRPVSCIWIGRSPWMTCSLSVSFT